MVTSDSNVVTFKYLFTVLELTLAVVCFQESHVAWLEVIIFLLAIFAFA